MTTEHEALPCEQFVTNTVAGSRLGGCLTCGWRLQDHPPATNDPQGDAPRLPAMREVRLHACPLCLGGAGGECHVPGCAFWMADAPKSPLNHDDGETDSANYRKWAGFLAAWVDFNCGKGTSDRAWESYMGNGPDDERPTWVPAHDDATPGRPQ